MRHSGCDIYFVEGEWAADKEAPRDPDGAFLAFFQSFAEKNPLDKYTALETYLAKAARDAFARFCATNA